jgi:hypothetical protein
MPGAAMTIDNTVLTFSTWLELAAFQAVRFGQSFVNQQLVFEFELYLNRANDDLAQGDFELYPEDDDRIVHCDDVGAVAAELVRKDRIPVWINISAYKSSKSFTLLRLICAGRFTDCFDELYFHRYGTGCFQFVSPDLPAGWKQGEKFNLQKA